MKRRLTQFLFALGLLLTLAAGTLWVCGFWVTDAFQAERFRTGQLRAYEVVQLFTGRHAFNCVWSYVEDRNARQRPTTPDRPWSFGHTTQAPDVVTFLHGDPGDPLRSRLGLDWGVERKRDGDYNVVLRAVTIPSWLLFVTCAAATAVPFVSLRRMRRRRRRAGNRLCPTCGYDLRGAAHDRCPECGHLVSASDAHGDPSSLSKMK
ncbi:MAG: zinc ribbon domain-containing protein [Tepidisphaeraceae bacterium]